MYEQLAIFSPEDEEAVRKVVAKGLINSELRINIISKREK
ncbi:hypothetical protein P615_06980 [Brevibacillus laterosporus PE36]|nr:hypothetical protein P615_06980 [Brevibacillus laterosporus PE36]